MRRIVLLDPFVDYLGDSHHKKDLGHIGVVTGVAEEDIVAFAVGEDDAGGLAYGVEQGEVGAIPSVTTRCMYLFMEAAGRDVEVSVVGFVVEDIQRVVEEDVTTIEGGVEVERPAGAREL